MRQTKTERLSDPIGAFGDRLYSLCTQNGLFSEHWGGHVPREMHGVWAHPIKLLDGFWFGLSTSPDGAPDWLIEATAVTAYPERIAFDYQTQGLTVTRQDCVPDGIPGMVISLTVTCKDPAIRRAGLTLHALFRSDLRPAWLGEERGMVDGADFVVVRQSARVVTQASGSAGYDPGTLRDAQSTIVATQLTHTQCVFGDSANDWTCIIGSDLDPAHYETGNALWGPQHTHGHGISAHLRYALTFDTRGEATLRFFIAGSTAGEANAAATLSTLRASHIELMDAKRAHAEATVRCSAITTPDSRLNDAITWSKLVTQMLVRDVPGIGSAVGAGFPEYPWWFGIDGAYAVLPMLQSGQFEHAKSILRFLMRASINTNPDEPGRVLHEMSSSGVVFNKGNMVETPAFVRAVHQTVEWTGDLDFLREMYDFCKQALIEYALGRNDADGDLCPSGRSIIETVEMHADFEVIDVATYTYEALWRLAELAQVMNEHKVADALNAQAETLAARIRDEWWLPNERLFADVRATRAEVDDKIGALQQIARQQHWLLEQQQQIDDARRWFDQARAANSGLAADVDGHWLLRHWVVMCPLESGIATPEQAALTLARLRTGEFCGEWGMYLHPERHDVMTVNTGLLAYAAARYGDNGLALEMIGKLTRAFSYRTPGAIAEALPDLWCFYQLWSNYGIVAPVVEYFMGITPRAHVRTITIAPMLPDGWNALQVERMRIGDDDELDASVTREGNTIRVRASGLSGYRGSIGVTLPVGARVAIATLNGQPTPMTLEDTHAGPRATASCAFETPVELVVQLG
jgi:glycogen debranching enzyme